MKIVVGFVLGLLCAAALAQTTTFKPGGNSVVNQGYAALAITPNDTVKFAVTRGIFNGNATACNIVAQLNGDSTTHTFNNVQSGQILPIQAVLVTTSSSCTNMIALY